MRKLLFAAALAIAVLTGHAQAADIGYGQPQYAPPPPPVAYRWMGPYFGANVGYLWGDVDNSGAQPSGLAGGIQAGYNWQNGIFVFGVEGDINICEFRRHLRAVEILESVVRHGARTRRRHGLEQHAVLRDRWSRLWWT